MIPSHYSAEKSPPRDAADAGVVDLAPIQRPLLAALLLHTAWKDWKGGIMNTLLRQLIAGAVVVSSCVVLGASLSGDTVAQTDALQMFDQRIAAYALLRQRAAASLPPLAPSADVRLILQGREALASAIITERMNTRRVGVFAPPVAEAFRRIIREALAGVDTAAMLNDLYEDCEMPVGYRPLVHARYPDWATHEVPIVLLAALPALPEGVMYRLIDLNLVIWDADADLIVEVLPAALPGAGS